MKSWWCLLTHWVLTTSILFKNVSICGSQLKCNYLKNENNFSKFFVSFLERTSNFDILKKKLIVIGNVFPELQTVKNLFSHSLKSTISGHPLTINMWKRPKYLQYLHDSTFVTFLIIAERADLENLSYRDTWNLRVVS